MRKQRWLWTLAGLWALPYLAQAQDLPRIMQVYPTSDTLPVNLMRFYVQFSQPMQEVGIYEHVHLYNAQGRELDSVFYKHATEFWNRDRTQVSLLVDPARVKRGLLAHNQLGRAFVEGERYTLTIDSLLLNFNDQPLASAWSVSFVAGPEDRSAPAPERWMLSAPTSGIQDSLRVAFQDKIDHISVHTRLAVGHNNQPVRGTWNYSTDQAAYFVPEQPWQPGTYQLLIHSALEDVAANSVHQIFDYDPDEYNPDVRPYYTVDFWVREAE
ncbi:MAG TPA: hypothetical protein DCR93_28450 [Cytophagales bacterium]|nr:hypothetical protein [Cytophagales bacterium]